MKTKRPVRKSIRTLNPVRVKIIAVIASVAVITSIGLAIAASLSQVAKVAATLTPGTAGCFALPTDKNATVKLPTTPIYVTGSTIGSCLAYDSYTINSPTCWDHTGGIFNQEDVTANKCISIWKADKGSRRYSFCPGKKCDSTGTVTQPLTVNMTRPYDTQCLAINTPITFSAQASGSTASSYSYKWDFDGQDDSSPIFSGQTDSQPYLHPSLSTKCRGYSYTRRPIRASCSNKDISC